MTPSVRILIVEDEKIIQDVLEAAFEDGGFAVAIVGSGEQAVAALDGRREAVQALVTDIDLGSRTTGWDVAKHARELIPDLPVVYVTGGEGHHWSSLGAQQRVDQKAVRDSAGPDRGASTAEHQQHSRGQLGRVRDCETIQYVFVMCTRAGR
jgi:CheY-like chemotaxis protein